MRARLLFAWAPIPAVAIGIIVMRASGAPVSRWGLQLFALLAGLVLYASIARTPLDRSVRRAPLLGALGLAVIAATLAAPGLLGVHRWLAAGPLRLNASALASPLVLVALCVLASRGRSATAALLAAATQLVHLVQPDAGQATAFGVAGACALAMSDDLPAWRWLNASALVASALLSWTRVDPLPAVADVEHILELALGLAAPVAMLGVLALATIPAILARATWRRRGTPLARVVGSSLTAYVACAMLVPAVGNFPVPALGFGASPILGIYLALGLAAAHGLGAPRPSAILAHPSQGDTSTWSTGR
jgi:cell division protein FtsW (lipid II flippase)